MDSSGTALGLELEDLKAIDTVRARLAQLTSSIQRLQGDVLMSNPLPPPESLQASAFVLQQNMASLNEVMTQHADLFRRIVVHPDPSFPGRTEEQVLTSLLRKKLEPDVEQMAERARDKAASRGISQASFDVKKKAYGEDDDDDDDKEEEEEDDDEDENGEDDDDDDDMFEGARQPYGLGDIWYDARGWCINQITTFIQEEAAQNYTKQEREQGIETVRTGLRRRLDDEEEEEEEDEDEEDGDEDDKMADAQPPSQTKQTAHAQAHAQAQAPTAPPVEPELLLWFASRGDTNLPRYVDIESQRAAVLTGAQRRM